MQKQTTDAGTDGTMTHPTAEEWMEFLYGESSEDRRRTLEAHAGHCASCRERLKEWQRSTAALDAWKLPTFQATAGKRGSGFAPLMKWGIAAVALLFAGFLAGHASNSSHSEIAMLKSSLAELTATVNQNQTRESSNILAQATEAASAGAQRLIAEYSAGQEEQRAADQKSVAFILNALELRLNKLHSELTTVALNTETGFHQTHENLLALASLSGNSPNSETLDSTSQQ